MPIQICSGKTGPGLREAVRHGTNRFPLACYADDMTLFSVPWHWHEEFECVVAVEGRIRLGVEGERFLLEPGQGLFINSGALHAVEQEPAGPAVLHSVVFHPRLVGGHMDSVFWQELIQPLTADKALHSLLLDPQVSWQGELIRDILAAWEAVTREDPDYENYARYRLSAGLGRLNRRRPADRLPGRQDQIDARRMKRMLEFLEAHYTEELTAERIAGSVSVSPSVCLRCFRKLLGMTPIRYLRQLRLEKAAHLLRATDLPVNRISLECGFSDVSYFTKTFRGEKGCAPREYRRKHRSQGAIP